jgi:hypothetical protein
MRYNKYFLCCPQFMDVVPLDYVMGMGICHAQKIGPSRVCALPLAAGINVGGHYKWHFFLFFLSSSLLSLPEGVVVGFCNFAWVPK